MAHKGQKSNPFIVDARTPNRIIKENDDNTNTYLVSYGNNQVLEDKDYIEVNYPELVEDYNFFITTGERYDQEFLQQKALQFSLCQIQENPIIEQHLLERNNKVQIKQQRKQTIRYKCLNILDIQINSSLKDKKLAIKMKANEGNITNIPSMEKLIKITHELQTIGYTQDELIVSFTLKNHQECIEDKSRLVIEGEIDKNIKMND
ncbi:unnamed protein product (macronuclear) [Paramecium tetraurelia]|uniref:Uncharacterized protein n=1 Tax=Paramecium tetraurelia TaxID=5888 RepID=A0DXM4_PARTE|nr:uncharacterized protein GSPATT00021415001 [Paramecium tetraurelia]CAK87791.1 unnamed protein product [Paramecium tetraurelia]|eukprot:XP_001455188.1 hypothetical protein (macronuclear) [Paramecium tetraurelia strain d4-2]